MATGGVAREAAVGPRAPALGAAFRGGVVDAGAPVVAGRAGQAGDGLLDARAGEARAGVGGLGLQARVVERGAEGLGFDLDLDFGEAERGARGEHRGVEGGLGSGG